MRPLRIGRASGSCRPGQPGGPVGHAAGQANPGLVQQPAGPLDGGLELADQCRAAASGAGLAPQRPAGALNDPVGVGELRGGHGGDLPGHREHELFGVTTARPQRLGDLVGPAARRTPTVPDPGPGRAPGRLHPLAGGHQLADRPRQQPHIGRVGHVRCDHGRVDPQLAAAQQLVVGELAKQRGVELLDDLGPQRRTSLLKVVGWGTGWSSGMRQNRRHDSESLTSRHRLW